VSAHGVYRTARALRVVQGTAADGTKQRLARHQHRQLARLQRRLDSEPLEAVRDGLIKSIANAELICDQADAALLMSPDIRQETGLAKYLGWMSNRLRRDRELLLLVEERLNPTNNGRAPSFVVLPVQPPTTVEGWNQDFGTVAEHGDDGDEPA